MKIIDAHMHYFNIEHFHEIAQAAGHENTAACWQQICQDNGIIFSVAMGNTFYTTSRYGGIVPRLVDLAAPFNEDQYNQPNDVGYCLGVQSDLITPELVEKTALEFEYYLKQPQCLGIKLYPGYNSVYVNDPRHWPLFELAKAYHVPIVIHTGDTSRPGAHLKYSHPLTIDDAAADFPETSFVMAHCGCPWFMDAAEVAAKNENVAIDLSGLMEGCPKLEQIFQEQAGFIQYLKTWLNFLNRYDKVMYGSDWPLVNIPTYIEFTKHIIPEKHWDKFYYQNALRLFRRINNLIKL